MSVRFKHVQKHILNISLLLSLSIFLFSCLAFASDSDLDQTQEPPEVESASYDPLNLDDVRVMEFAELLSSGDRSVPASTYSTDDIYTLLYAALRGTSQTSVYSLPRISFWSEQIWNRMAQTNTKLDNIYNVFATNTELAVGSGGTQVYTLAELVGMCWDYLGDIATDTSYLSSISYNLGVTNNKIDTVNSNLGSLFTETQRTNAKLEYVFSAIEDTINIKWYSHSDTTFYGTSLGYDTNFLTSSSSSRSFKTSISFTNGLSNSPNVFRIFFPIYLDGNFGSSPNYTLTVKNYRSGSFIDVSVTDYFFENTLNGTYLYLFDFRPFYGTPYYFELSSNSVSIYNSDYANNLYYIPFDTFDYQIMKSAFYQAKSANSLDQLDTIVSLLGQIAPSQSYQSAESASQDVINETLDDFTGSGTGAAKRSDSRAMKDVSGSVQSGLNTGGSVSNATSVFDSSTHFWDWFTQTTSNNINNPYPAPVVQNVRGSGDEIVDFLSSNQEEMRSMLGDQR